LEVDEPFVNDARCPTFETRVPLSMSCHGPSVVTVDDEDLVGGGSGPVATMAAPFFVSCRFCVTMRQWSQITSYWSHLKKKHPDISKERRLEQIRASALDYKSRARPMSNNYNPTTWAKVEQAVAPIFTWDVVESWRLPKDTVKADVEGN
jgi:hypothetical protein